MTIITLLEKAYGSFSTRTFESLLTSLCRDLRVEIRVQGAKNRNWIQIEVTGEDEAAATNLLDREIGLAPISANRIGNFSTIRGKIIDTAKSKAELYVDIGVLEPRIRDAAIPLERLRAQLGDGKNVQLRHLVNSFCLQDYVPLRIKILGDLDPEKDVWEAELSELQLAEFSDWLRSGIDRLVVLGASRTEVEEAVSRAHHFRDVIRVETLGPFEHTVLCKLGTDAVGLVPKLGPFLGGASLTPFSPRRIRQLATEHSL